MALESLRGQPSVVPREYCRRIAERLSERAQAGASESTGPEPNPPAFEVGRAGRS